MNAHTFRIVSWHNEDGCKSIWDIREWTWADAICNDGRMRAVCCKIAASCVSLITEPNITHQLLVDVGSDVDGEPSFVPFHKGLFQ